MASFACGSVVRCVSPDGSRFRLRQHGTVFLVHTNFCTLCKNLCEQGWDLPPCRRRSGPFVRQTHRVRPVMYQELRGESATWAVAPDKGRLRLRQRGTFWSCSQPCCTMCDMVVNMESSTLPEAKFPFGWATM